VFRCQDIAHNSLTLETFCETTIKANRRISNIEPQNVEVWNRFAQSLFNRQNALFDVGRSMFDVRCSLVSFSIRLDARGQRRRSYETSSFKPEIGHLIRPRNRKQFKSIEDEHEYEDDY
jgi:hypothetical protein